MSIEIIPIPAFKDNYMWLLHNGRDAVVVDPGESEPVEQYLSEHNLSLTYILITHHHWDHVNGLKALQDQWQCEVFAPADPRIEGQLTTVKEGDEINLKALDSTLKILEIPGHTLSHICFYNDQYLFCGDTLFSMGCGRMFEGQPAQFVASLEKLKNLPPTTEVYCGHEYTLNNIEFALTIEPNSHEIKALKNSVIKQRKQNKPTLPVQLAQELKLNPFLRTNEIAFQASLSEKLGTAIEDQVSCFALLRNDKDEY